MKTDAYYIVRPTDAFRELAERLGFSWVINPAIVYYTDVHDRTGPEESKAEVAEATWIYFVGNFDLEAKEDREHTIEFLRECLGLGGPKCWTVEEVRHGVPASELLDDANRLSQFAIENLAKIQE